MKSPISVNDGFDQHGAARMSTDATQQIAAPFTEAANDDEFHRNPLWLVAGAMALLFGILACLVAAG
jgi:hypothetical protein